MVKLQEEVASVRPLDTSKMGNFVLDRNGQLDINRRVMENNYGFRLQEINHNTEICSNKDLCDETTTSVSGYSNYKQRIDAMFDDTRSLISDRSKDLDKHVNKKGSKSLLDNRMKLLEDYEERNDRKISNNIQEKIEKMFEEISIHGFQKSNSFKNIINKRKEAQNPASPSQNTLSHDFKVIYLGSQPLADKSVSLISLQDPLKELYFAYKRKRIRDHYNTLTISREGLKIKILEKENLNPFPTIAVWASVKLAFRNSQTGVEYAFLPLIRDPDGIDKNILFKELKNEDKNIILSHFQGKLDDDSHSPIFAVVMRNADVNKQLECHGFICTTSEEAIVIAANLYQALIKKLKKKNEKNEKGEKKEVETEKNYANYLKETPETTENEDTVKKPIPKVKKIPPPVPNRPPRKTKKPSDDEDLIDLDEETFEEARKPEMHENKVQRRGSVPNNVFTVGHEPVTTLKRSVSERRNSGITVNDNSEVGDILTKVAIPRSRSFLNANGPLTRYSRRYKSNTHNDIISPLGFSELFTEFRLNEGLESMDDILNAIIDAEGMSFNDLKPIYKEFLLKLAVTLTKDELYQRSKLIMRRQKKKSRSCVRKKPFISTTGIGKVFRKTASKLGKTKSSRSAGLEFTSVVFQSSGKHFETSTSSTSSCGAKPKPGVKRRQSSRRRVNKKPERTKSKKLSTTSDDSDFFMRRNTTESGGCPNRSSSGYFSCSECSYDSENCTCTSADKCYCTLGQNKKTEPINSSTVESKYSEKDKSNPSLHVTPLEVQYEKDKDSVKSCGCDTESCVDSEKCYCSGNAVKEPETKVVHLSDVKGICQTPHLHQNEPLHNVTCPNYQKNSCKKHGQTIFEQLKQQGFAASDSSLSRAASPSTAWRNNEEKMRKPKECLKTSKSLEFLQIRRPENRQQIQDCPPPPQVRHASLQDVLLKEIQNTNFRSSAPNFVEGTRHFCYHGPEFERSFRRSTREVPPTSSFHTGRRRQYSSMRSRNEFPMDFSSSHGSFQRDTSYRSKNRLFSSMRSKHSCDSILNHVLFPEASRNSSLRFTRRMDVYNSFYKRNRLERQGSYIDLLNQIQNGYVEPENDIDIVPTNLMPERHVCPHEKPQMYQSSGGSDNFQKIDYDLFTTSSKSETSETVSNGSERKVLVVSARDPKGKVLYMGASSRGEKSNKLISKYSDNSSGNACEALSVKKSAEIAALFSDVSIKPKINRTAHLRDEKYYKDYKRSNSYRCTNMENTLGYLP